MYWMGTGIRSTAFSNKFPSFRISILPPENIETYLF